MKFIPNYIASGFNEKSLFDKISPFIKTACDWAELCVSPFSVADGSEMFKDALEDIVCIRALTMAAPMLDVTLHPNGLAVVNTESLAPASKERSLEFRNALEGQLLDKTDHFLSHVYRDKGRFEIWRNSIPAKSIWLGTVFFNCSDIVSFCRIPKQWNSLIETIRKIQAQEFSFGRHFISPELMARFRAEKLPPENCRYPEAYIEIRWQLMSAIADSLFSEMPGIDVIRLNGIVDVIRKYPSVFPEWHSSETAKLFSPPVFRNKKKSGGYFF